MFNSCYKITDIYIKIMLLIFPLWTGFEGYADITRSKFLFFVTVTLLWFFLLIIAYLRTREKPNCGIRPALIIVGVYVLFMCLSALFSDYGNAVLLGASRYDGLITLLLYALIFAGVSAYGQAKLNYITYAAVACILCCAVALLQLLNFNPLGLFPEGLDYYDSGILYVGAFLGTMGNTNILSAYLSILIPIFFVFSLTCKEKKLRLLCLKALILALLTLILSGVSGGIVGLLGAAVLCTPIALGKRYGKKVFLICIAVLLIFALLAFVVVYFFPPESGTVYELSQILHGNIDDSFGSSRVMIWRECLALVPETPLFGGGPDTLVLRVDLNFERYVEESGITLRSFTDNAHCVPLAYLVNTGIFGLLSYLALFAYAFYKAVKAKGILPAALGIALVSYFIQSLFGLGLSLVMPLVFIILGLLSANNFDSGDVKNVKRKKART